ncbi:MAG: DMT family transporter, partial [Pseudomonadota bacterium]
DERPDRGALGPRFARRSVGLFVLGALHAVFLFFGDILAFYALLALPLLWLAGWILEPNFLDQPLQFIQTPAWIGLLYSAIGASIIGHGLFYWLIQRHEVNRITPYLLTVPVMAVGLSVWIWGDRPGLRLILGGGLVIVGVLWITLRAQQRSLSTATHPTNARVPHN